jgi:dipeptidyl aminopeptidase/acylaminoacyl peptidase
VLTYSGGLVELSLPGNSERRLVEAPTDTTLADPAVSPDGTRIAYTQLLTPVVVPGQNTDLGSDVYIANADGTGPQLIVKHAVRSEQVVSPAWLPDGSGLLFSVQRFESRQIVTTVEKIDLATRERTVLIENGYQPAMSRDGTQIAFLRTQPDYTQSVWVANADGSGERLLAGTASASGGLVSFQSPRFSLDGRYLYTGAAGMPPPLGGERQPALASARDGAGGVEPPVHRNGLPQDIWRIDLSSGELMKIVELQIDSPSVFWAGDGAVLFVFGDRGLYQIDPEKRTAKRLRDGEYHGQADWLAAK